MVFVFGFVFVWAYWCCCIDRVASGLLVVGLNRHWHRMNLGSDGLVGKISLESLARLSWNHRQDGIGTESTRQWNDSTLNGCDNKWTRRQMNAMLNGLGNNLTPNRWRDGLGIDLTLGSNGLRTESTRNRIDSESNGLRTESTPDQIDSESNGLRIEWTPNRMDSVLNGFGIERTRHQMNDMPD